MKIKSLLIIVSLVLCGCTVSRTEVERQQEINKIRSEFKGSVKIWAHPSDGTYLVQNEKSILSIGAFNDRNGVVIFNPQYYIEVK